MAILLKSYFRYFLTVLLFLFCFCSRPEGKEVLPQANAMDPVTIAILAPVALKVARDFSPNVMKAMQCTGHQITAIGTDLFHVFYLPWGVVQGIFGTPFGYGGNALQNIGTGIVAPFQMGLNVCLLPLAFFGIYGAQ